MVVFTYMTHTLSIRATQKKEHILMVEKRNSAPWCLCSGGVHDLVKEGSDLFLDSSVYVETCMKRPFKQESPVACKFNRSFGLMTCFLHLGRLTSHF